MQALHMILSGTMFTFQLAVAGKYGQDFFKSINH